MKPEPLANNPQRPTGVAVQRVVRHHWLICDCKDCMAKLNAIYLLAKMGALLLLLVVQLAIIAIGIWRICHRH